MIVAAPLLAESQIDEDAAIQIDAGAHPEIAAILEERNLEAFILRPDFYCFGAVGSGNRDGVADLLGSFRDQVAGQ